MVKANDVSGVLGRVVGAAGATPHRYELRALGDLKPNPKNARLHPKKQINEIVRSYREYGVINPIVVSPDLGIVAGHGRYLAAKAIGLTEVAVLIVDGLTPAQLRAYALADNKIGDMSTFDMELVLEEIGTIVVDDIDFDITLTGFATAEIDIASGATRTAKLNDLEDDPPVRPTKERISRLDDLWQLGPHRVLCANSLEPTAMETLIGNGRVRLVLSDVPYNVRIAGNVSGLGRQTHADFAMASGEMTSEEFVSFLRRSAKAVKPYLINGAMVLWFISWHHVGEMLEAGKASGFNLKNVLVWAKNNAGMGSLWRSQHELVCAFRYGTATGVNNVQLGAHGRDRSNVLFYPGMNEPGKGRNKALELHSTVKPVALISDLILDVSKRGDIVLDPFGGSGTAIVAAEKVERVAYLAEISPEFVDVTVRRWEALTGGQARLAATGQTFAEVRTERLDSTRKEG